MANRRSIISTLGYPGAGLKKSLNQFRVYFGRTLVYPYTPRKTTCMQVTCSSVFRKVRAVLYEQNGASGR